jgi:hypothetical protein
MPTELTPQQAGLITAAAAWPERVKAVAIRDAITANEAGHMLTDIQTLMRQADDEFDADIREKHAAHKEAIALKQRVVDPLNRAKGALRGALASWADAERKRLEQQERERLRALAEERAREEAERQRRAAEEEAIRAAAAAQDAGDNAAAEEMLTAAITAPAPVVAPEPVTVTPKVVVRVAGASFRPTWAAEVVDAKQLLGYISSPDSKGRHLDDLIQGALDGLAPVLNRLAREWKSTLDIPGVRAVEFSTTVQR